MEWTARISRMGRNPREKKKKDHTRALAKEQHTRMDFRAFNLSAAMAHRMGKITTPAVFTVERMPICIPENPRWWQNRLK